MYQGQGFGFLRIVGLVTVIRAIRRRARRRQLRQQEGGGLSSQKAERARKENEDRE